MKEYRPEGENAALPEQVRVLLENLPSVLIVNLAVAAIFLLLIGGHLETWELGSWLAALLVMVAVRTAMVLRCRRVGVTPANAGAWSRRFTWGALASGCIWGTAGVMMGLAAPHDAQGLAVVILGGLAAGAIATHSAIMRVYLAFVLPLLLPFTLLLFGHSDSGDPIKGALMAFFAIAMPAAAWRYKRVLHHAIVLRSQYQRISEELTRHRDHLQELVDERTADLNSAKEVAESANRAKSEFLASISHEIRTPMHAVLSFAAIGEEQSDEATRERLREYFTYIRDSGRRLLGLLNDLLDLSKLDARQMQMEREEQDLQEVARTAITEFGGLIEEKALAFELVPAQVPTVVWCDPRRMLQVLRNLIANAIRHSPEGGRIRIRFAAGEIATGRRHSDTEAVPALDLSVVDQGTGIPPEELETIFDEFFQSSRFKPAADSTGLGLAICRRIVEMHGGIIRAGNTEQGGAVFTVSLPYGHR